MTPEASNHTETPVIYTELAPIVKRALKKKKRCYWRKVVVVEGGADLEQGQGVFSEVTAKLGPKD